MHGVVRATTLTLSDLVPGPVVDAYRARASVRNDGRANVTAEGHQGQWRLVPRCPGPSTTQMLRVWPDSLRRVVLQGALKDGRQLGLGEVDRIGAHRAARRIGHHERDVPGCHLEG